MANEVVRKAKLKIARDIARIKGKPEKVRVTITSKQLQKFLENLTGNLLNRVEILESRMDKLEDELAQLTTSITETLKTRPKPKNKP